jgi:uncharacterized protein (DUF1697 family)
MPRYIAFLRAVNVGGRNTVRMDFLRRLFESLGFSNVETFIASGNVVFDAKQKNAQALGRVIEDRLREALGFEVATFVRTCAELAAVAGHEPFSRADIEGAAALNITFLADAPDDEASRKLMALRTDVDDFRVNGREVYWLCRKRQSDSKISNAAIEKALGQKATMRGANTVRKMAAKYS